MRRTRGFTLIELLVVIAIIGLLSSIVLASLSTARNKAYDARRVSDLHSLQTAIELYASDHNGQYPATPSAQWQSQCSTWGSFAASNVIPGLVPTYIPSMPADPQMNVSTNLCCYIYKSNGTDYKLLAHNCPTSNTCYGPGEATGGFQDPTRTTYACAVYTPNASTW